MYQDECRTRLLHAVSKGMEQGKNAGVGERDSQSYRSRYSEANDKGNQQTPQVRPTFPLGRVSCKQRLATDGFLSG
jgi:hypothetical protein